MINRTNQILELEDGREFGILKHILYQNRTFFIASELTEDKQNLKEDIIIMEQISTDGKDEIIPITDEEIIRVIVEKLEDK